MLLSANLLENTQNVVLCIQIFVYVTGNAFPDFMYSFTDVFIFNNFVYCSESLSVSCVPIMKDV